MSLRLRLLAAFAYVLVLVIVALEVALAISLSRRVDAEVRQEAAGQAQVLAARVAGRLTREDELRRMVGGAAGDLGGRVIVVDARGLLLADSEGPGLAGESYASRPEIATALAGRTAQGTRRSESLDQELLYTTVPVLDGERSTGAVRVTQSVSAVRAQVRRAVLGLVVVGLAALAVGLGVAWLLAGSLARPLHRLAATARRVGDGDLEARAEPAGSLEQREVALAFNETVARLGSALAAQREFVANASHSLRTPLTGLRLRLEAAALKSGDPEVERELAAGERELDRLAKLLGALLTLAREGAAPVGGTRVALDEAVESALDRWRATAERAGVALEAGGVGNPAAITSRDDLAIVLDNLLENAIEHSPLGGRVTVEWRGDGERAIVAVSDQGPGLEPAEAEQAFERFYRGRSSRERPAGTGLGLAIVQALIRRWGGSASIESGAGAGARAEFVLPAAARASATPVSDPSGELEASR